MKSYLMMLALVSLIIIPAYAQPDFTAYTAGNPVIPRGTAGSWDVGAVWGAHLTVVNDTFYVIYNGSQNVSTQPVKIGLAISTDGYTFTKSPAIPILSGDGSGFDAYSVDDAIIFYDTPIWYLYYCGLAAPPNLPGRIISRATAANPHGPWTRTDDTLLAVGNTSEWDDKLIFPLQLLPTDTGLAMFYCGSDEWYPFVFKIQIGLATSTDGGQTWRKYDDPATTSPPNAESDPVLKAGPESFDNFGIFGAGIVRNGNNWEMFYSGYVSNTEGAICYASSLDGIHWAKNPGNPIYTFWEDPLAVYGYLEIPSVALYGSTYFLYYDYGIGPNSAGIGLATAPIVGIEQWFESKIANFKLYQNYPNPFNPTTTIEFSLPQSDFVTLKIYNLVGEEVATLLSASLLSGSHQCEWDASGMASGVYFYRLSVGSLKGEAGEWVMTKKLVLLR